MSNGTPTTPTHGLTGWWAQVAQLTAVGALIVLLFIMYHKQMAEVQANRDAMTEYHGRIEAHMAVAGERARVADARADATLAEVRTLRNEVVRLEWRLGLQTHGVGYLFTGKEDPPKDKGP